MRNVTTAYHEANKADTRSSDFLIIADTGVALDRVGNYTGWTKRTLDSDLGIAQYRCTTKSNASITNYGYFDFINYYNECLDSNGIRQGIHFFFENCYPTEVSVSFYKSTGTLAKTITWENNSPHLKLTYENLYDNALKNTSNLYKVRFSFKKWNKQDVYPVILYTAYGEPAIFLKDDLLSVDITLETDPTAQSIPYNSYACSVIDEIDAYNPLLLNSKIYDFALNQKFKFYNFEMGIDTITDDISLFDHEICPIGTAYFRNAIQQGSAVNFDFIDIVEKYDKTPLSETELELSSHFIKRNVKDYLTVLFGNDLDTSLIPEDLESITPFYKESKTQILLYLAQLMHKYLYVTTSGVISFKDRSDWTEDFSIELEQSYQNPTIEKTYDNNGVEVSVYAYSSSQNTELAFNRIEFIFDGETKVYYNGSTLYDAETNEEILRIPRFDFNELQMKYVFNDVYDRDSLFGLFFGIPMYMSEVKENIAEAKTSIKYENDTLNVIYRFAYCDTHMTVTMTSEERTIESSYENYYDVVEGMSGFFLLFNQLQGCKITSSTNTVKRKRYNSTDSSSAIVIDNPAIADLNTAKVVRDWMYEQIEHSAYSIDTSWRGDCSLELGDEATAEIAITQNGVKDYESRYIGVVVKNIIEYNGALKMQTTLYSPSQKRWNDTTLCDTSTKVSASLKV